MQGTVFYTWRINRGYENDICRKTKIYPQAGRIFAGTACGEVRRVKTGGYKMGNWYGYTYDGNGNLETKTDPDGYVTTYGYNGLDMVTSINYNNGK